MLIHYPLGGRAQEISVIAPAPKPEWRVDKPFGEKLSSTHLRHYYVGGMEFAFPNGWQIERVSPNSNGAIRRAGGGAELSANSLVSHDKIQGGAFLKAKSASGEPSINVVVLLERVPQGMSDTKFVANDQKTRRLLGKKQLNAPAGAPAVSLSRAWIGGRSCSMVDVDVIYPSCSLLERYYYVPILPDNCTQARTPETIRYTYILKITTKSHRTREKLALSVPGIVQAAGPLRYDGYFTQSDVDAQNMIFNALNNGKLKVDSQILEGLLDACDVMASRWENARSAFKNPDGEVDANAAWSSVKSGVVQSQFLRNQLHDQIALHAWEELTPPQQVSLEKTRPDFVAAIDLARGNAARQIFGNGLKH